MSGKRHRRFRELYYITHLENVPSILEHGILSHAEIERRRMNYVRLYDHASVSKRQSRTVPDGRSLWKFANLYFQPRNPMLYRVLRENAGQERDVVVLGVKKEVLDLPDVFITTGNAASAKSEIWTHDESLQRLQDILHEVNVEFWAEKRGTKHRIMAEVLVPERVPPEYITTIYVRDHQAQKYAQKYLRAALPHHPVEIVPEPHMFFAPKSECELTPDLHLIEGDMFFSGMQTLTITVNTVGVMGKGLAFRAKFQFPDTFVAYRHVCKSGELVMGRPYLYKREKSLDEEMAEDPASMRLTNRETWFLFFPTKRHWRQKSDLAGIEQGLEWLHDNYRREGITSLALPALGCGLGQLAWADVGPRMCRALVDLDIPVRVYLPREGSIPPAQRTAEFLLGST